MRLWSLHPRYLDAKGLVALWREGLLAQKVLEGKTRGYRHHPQLLRFRQVVNPMGAMAVYLTCVADEAERRNYTFDRTKIVGRRASGLISVKAGQIDYEFKHLLAKLKQRDPDRYKAIRGEARVKLHPLFRRTKGGVEEWEIV